MRGKNMTKREIKKNHRQKIIEYMEKKGKPASPLEIAKSLEISNNMVSVIINNGLGLYFEKISYANYYIKNKEIKSNTNPDPNGGIKDGLIEKLVKLMVLDESDTEKYGISFKPEEGAIIQDTLNKLKKKGDI